MLKRKVKLSCELTPVDDNERVECQMHIEGDPNGLLNAYGNITVQLMEALIEASDKETAMQLYAAVQCRSLEKIGIDPEAEAAKAEKKKAVLEGLKSILGKTFTMPEKEGGAE